jgi:hypothetical protein
MDVTVSHNPKVAGSNPAPATTEGRETKGVGRDDRPAPLAVDDRELGVVLPVGCGKSGLIAITPFAFRARRVLVVAPNVRIAQQLYADVNPPATRFSTSAAGSSTAGRIPNRRRSGAGILTAASRTIDGDPSQGSCACDRATGPGKTGFVERSSDARRAAAGMEGQCQNTARGRSESRGDR